MSIFIIIIIFNGVLTINHTNNNSVCVCLHITLEHTHVHYLQRNRVAQPQQIGRFSLDFPRLVGGLFEKRKRCQLSPRSVISGS